MRRLYQYIFCFIVLAALIFQSFTLFYIANTYATKNKTAGKLFGDSAKPEHTQAQPAPPAFLSVSDAAIEEITAESVTESEFEYTPEELPDDATTPAVSSEETSETQAVIPAEHTDETITPTTTQQSDDTTMTTFNEETETPDETDETGETPVNYTQEELLYQILITQQQTQYIIIFICSCALVWLFVRPFVLMLK